MDDTASTVSDARRPGRRAVALALLAFALMIGLGRWQLHDVDPDQTRIAAERAHRLAAWKRGEALPATPDLAQLSGRLAQSGLTAGAPVFILIFKREFELELWLKRDGRYQRFAVYPICRFSGGLGPKLIEGDSQSPEGFYTIDRRAMNPHSRWHRAFNLGFPNAYDRARGRTGSFLMVHGGCSSVGCYAMTNPVIDEVWRLIDAALRAGQKTIQVHAYPFRPSTANLAARASHPAALFWQELKAGYDAFEETRIPPCVTVCNRHYRVRALAVDDPAAGEVVAQCGEADASDRHAADGRTAGRPVVTVGAEPASGLSTDGGRKLSPAR